MVGSSRESSAAALGDLRHVVGRPPCLLLWDVDHTLIASEGVSKEIYAAAFRRLTGREPEHRARTEGRTDPQIMEGMLKDHGIEPSEDYAMRLHDALTAAGREKAARLRVQGHALPGAEDTLKVIASTDGVAQSVLTGNIMANAIVKLAAFGLDGYIDFTVGGFGSDHVVRSMLVSVARARAEAKYGVPAAEWSTVLVGDTPRDVEAGRDGGARVLGVATGVSSMTELRSAGADAVVPDLQDSAGVTRLVLELAGAEA